MAEDEFSRLEQSAKLSKSEPLFYWLDFIKACFFFAVAIHWILHIYFWVIVKTFDRNFHPFFNEMLEFFFENNMEFVATCLYVLLSLYMLWAAFRGNFKFGLRMYLPSFYPMLENETFMGSFLFVAVASSVWTFTLLQFMCASFSQYIRGTDADIIFNILLRNSWFFGWFWQRNFWPWMLVVWVVIAFFYSVFKPVERLTGLDELNIKDLEANRV